MTAQNIRLDEFLGGLEYPIYKYQVMNEAAEWDLNHDVLSLLSNLPDTLYENPAQLAMALNQKAK